MASYMLSPEIAASLGGKIPTPSEIIKSKMANQILPRPPVSCYDPALLGGVLLTHSDLSRPNAEVVCGLLSLSHTAYPTATGGVFFKK